jgi:hypothetical protein
MQRGTETVTDPTTGKKYSFPAPVRHNLIRRDWKPLSDEQVEKLLAEPEPEDDPDC